jgi:hypothetical protein
VGLRFKILSLVDVSKGPPPSLPFLFKQVLFIGNGNSAKFFASMLPKGTDSLILSENHGSLSHINVLLWWEPGKSHTIPFADSPSDTTLQNFFNSGNENNPLLVVCSTNPQRFQHWMDELINSGLSIPDTTTFVLPQSPSGSNVQHLLAINPNFTVVVFDFFPGIGKAITNPETGDVTIKMGVKDRLIVSIVNGKEDTIQVPIYLSGNKEVKTASPFDLTFLPTNALLHSCGVLSHFAEAGKGDIKDLVNGLTGKGFYREMPALGPVIIEKLSQEILNLKIALRERFNPQSSVETDMLLDEHLKGKYIQSYEVVHGEHPEKVSLLEFINRNPYYQNPGIVFPVSNERINTSHRFFTEELATLVMLYKAGMMIKKDGDMSSVKAVISLIQMMMDKVYWDFSQNIVGPDAPEYLKTEDANAFWKLFGI